MKVDLPLAIVLFLPTISLSSGAVCAQSPTTTRVSVRSDGVQADDESGNPSISADGRFVAFQSLAANLVAIDTNSMYDIFVHDRLTGSTERVSVDSSGAQANSWSVEPCISADGRFVAFNSDASNLVANDTNSFDIFVHDRNTGTTELVSIDSAGAQANGTCFSPTISGDGRFVAFHSVASNLVAGDTNQSLDVFLRDRMTSTTRRVSVDSLGAQANSNSYSHAASISADGRCIAFESNASNLTPGDANSAADTFVHDRTNGRTERVNIDSAGVEANADSWYCSISADGNVVAFASFATNLVAGDTNGASDVFIHYRQSGITERVSVDSSGAQGDANSFRASLSADGRFLAFRSGAANLVFGDTNVIDDIFVRNLSAGTTERVSVDSAGVEANDYGFSASISADGRFVAIWSRASNLVAGDTNGVADIFVRDRGPLLPYAYCTSGTSSQGCNAIIAASVNPSLSLASPCNITLTGVDGQKSGIVFYGINNSGFWPAPWASGSTSWLCVKQPAQRTPLQNSGGTFGVCNGSYTLDWNAYQTSHPLALGNPWSVGDKVYVQAWFRDPPAVKSTNLSNAVEMTYLP